MRPAKWNPICIECVRDCKQPPAVGMVSCPKFERADKNLDLFDSAGKVKTRLINPAPAKKKKFLPPRKK